MAATVYERKICVGFLQLSLVLKWKFCSIRMSAAIENRKLIKREHSGCHSQS